MAGIRKYPPKDAAEVILDMSARGFSQIGIASHFHVVVSTFKRWIEENEALSEAYEQGKETERQYLHSLIVQCAVQGKPANANAMFLLKARHGYREFDSQYSAKVNVAVNAPQPVMIVHDMGTDAQWAAKVAEQQRKLTAPDPALDAPPAAQNALPAPVGNPASVHVSVDATAPAYGPPSYGPPQPAWAAKPKTTSGQPTRKVAPRWKARS